MERRNIAATLGIAVLVLALALLMVSWSPRPPPTLPAAPQPPPQPLPAAPPTPEPAAPLAAPPRPTTAAGQATLALAQALGEYAVACPVPDDEVAFNMPDRSEIEDGQLHIVVENAIGGRMLWVTDGDSEPYRLLTWRAASEGTGTCAFEVLEQIRVEGMVVSGEGPTVTHVRCKGRPGHFAVSEQGRFTAVITRGRRCYLTAQHGRWHAVALFDSVHPPEMLRVGPLKYWPDVEHNMLAEMKEMADDKEAALAHFVSMANPFDLALEGPQITDAAAELLRAWRDEEYNELAVDAEQHREMADQEQATKDRMGDRYPL